jgi:hypothetical protein
LREKWYLTKNIFKTFALLVLRKILKRLILMDRVTFVHETAEKTF